MQKVLVLELLLPIHIFESAMSPPKVLIIDDEPDIRELLEITLGRMQLDTYSAENKTVALKLLSTHSFDLCLTDMRLPDGTGLEIVCHVQQHYPNTPIAMITAYGSMETAIQALKAGAFDFISKPVDLLQLRELVKNALQLKASSPSATDTVQEQGPLIGSSETMQSLRAKIKKLARSQAPVYISGESGSGKELVARQIHALGNRAKQPFIPVNCGAIPDELMESEFFGHKKGSFTGAHSDKAGLFQAAHGGTLFLDEVADLPLAMQVKLLRAIQEKAIRPIGAQQETLVDVRILSATHKNLAQEVAEERFRQDLYYRLNVIELSIPPLRERGDDIVQLSQLMLSRLCDNAEPIKLTTAAIKKLKNHSFPGNVRELENMLERAYTLCEGQLIDADDLYIGQPITQPKAELGVQTVTSGHSLHLIENLEDHLEHIERDVIVQALEETQWNRTAAAERLGLTFRSLRYRLKKLGID